MRFADVVRGRRMVRNYDPDRPVPPQVLDRLLDHAVRAPSAGFTQGWGFLVLTEPADRELFWSVTADRGRTGWLERMSRAPVIVVPHGSRDEYLKRYAETDKGRSEVPWDVPYWYVDAGFASLLMLLGAVDEGLGACFFGIPAGKVDGYRAAFGVPAEFAPVGALTIGYPAPGPRSPSLRRGRKPVGQVTYRGRWAVPY
jgi:nitroreductase